MDEIMTITKTGTQPFMGREIPIVLGGFGPNARCVCDKTVAEIHEMKVIHIRELINRNIHRFQGNVDFIDLKTVIVQDDNNPFDVQDILQALGYTNMEIGKAEHIYILSERGYAKLVKIMDTDKAWEVYNHLLDEYFQLREGTGMSIEMVIPKDYPSALRALADAAEKNMELTAKIETDKPLTEFALAVSESEDFVTVGAYAKLLHDRDSIDIGRNRLYGWLREHGYLTDRNEPYQCHVSAGLFALKLKKRNRNIYPVTLITGKGMVKLYPEIAVWWSNVHPDVPKPRSVLELDEINQYILEAKAKGYTERRMADEIGTISNVAVHNRIDKLRKAGLLPQ